MGSFYNRNQEITRLTAALKRKKPQLIVLYGRRRCGKSTLIRQQLVAGDVYYLAQQTQASLQISQFAAVVESKIPGFGSVIYPGWEALFTQLAQRIQKRMTLCLDEFPYMVSVSPELPSVLQSFIDHGRNLHIDIILCGSSQQMMQGLVLDRAAPLFGRATEVLKVGPLEAGWLTDALGVPAAEAVQEYSIWGGIPRYWELRQEYPSLNTAIKGLLLDRFGTLNEEPARLLMDELRASVQVNSILTIIGQGCHRLSEIASRLQLPPTQLSRPLSRLIELGYVRREIPFGENIKNNKRSLYKIADPLMRFYYKYVIPQASMIELGLGDQIFTTILKSLHHHTAEEWESLCRRGVSVAPICDMQFGPALRWWGNDQDYQPAEIDLISESLDKKTLLIGECKWSHVTNVQTLLTRLEHKASLLPFIGKRNVLPVLFVKSTPRSHAQVLTAEEVIARLQR